VSKDDNITIEDIHRGMLELKEMLREKKKTRKSKKNYVAKKQKEVLTISQIKALINGATTIQEKLMVRTMLKCGFRVSELVNFKIEWINFEDKIIRIQKNERPLKWIPKYGSVRELPASESLLTELRQFIGRRVRGYVFRSRKKANHRRYNTDSIIHKINRLKKRVLGNKGGTHIFRRTYASYLLNSGHDLVTISKYMGHSSVKYTFDYLKQIPDREHYDETRKMEIMDL